MQKTPSRFASRRNTGVQKSEEIMHLIHKITKQLIREFDTATVITGCEIKGMIIQITKIQKPCREHPNGQINYVEYDDLRRGKRPVIDVSPEMIGYKWTNPKYVIAKKTRRPE